MTRLLLMYAFFLAGGMALLIRKRFARREKALFIGITTIGALLWGSIIVRHPLDLNQAIAWMFAGFR